MRSHSLMPDGVPRYIRCYDNGGKTADRYTVIFTRKSGFLYIGCSSDPFNPMGIGYHGQSCGNEPIDRPTSSHLGKRVKFENLPEPVKKFTIDTYRDLWEISEDGSD